MSGLPYKDRLGAARVPLSVAASILLGGVFGAVATIGMHAGFMVEFGFFFGLIIGLMCSPALVFALRLGPWIVSVLLIGAAAATAAYLGGLATPPNGGPQLSIAASVPVYLIACFVRGRLGRKLYPPLPPGACRNCGYDCAGIPNGGRCPECGTFPS